jgi:hypothetical protein
MCIIRCSLKSNKEEGETATVNELLPDGEDLRRAVKWASGCLQDHPERQVRQVVDEATFRFNLSPRDAEFLSGFFRERQTKL